MTRYDDTARALREKPKAWLVTGAAGFIGSHLVERLLALGQRVTALDNLATGYEKNLDLAVRGAGQGASSRLTVIKGDIRDAAVCAKAVQGVSVVVHQAALGSVPRSLKDPQTSHAVNVDGFVNVLLAARDAGVKRFVYASSSSVYGDHPALPKVEDQTGTPLSPYAATKAVNELYARVLGACYGLETIGLRYFNVVGARQDPNGAYAAVVPRWVASMLAGEPTTIFGDGETSRDFCPVENVVQINILAGCVDDARAFGQVYNVALGGRTTLLQLHQALARSVERARPALKVPGPLHAPFRDGDVRHSLADISKARELLGYVPAIRFEDAIDDTVRAFTENPT